MGGLPSEVIFSLNFSTALSISNPHSTAVRGWYGSSLGALCMCIDASPIYLITIPSLSSIGCVIASMYPFIILVSPFTSSPNDSPNGVNPRKSLNTILISRFIPSLISAGFSCNIRTTVGDAYPANCFLIACFSKNSFVNLLNIAWNPTRVVTITTQLQSHNCKWFMK